MTAAVFTHEMANRIGFARNTVGFFVGEVVPSGGP